MGPDKPKSNENAVIPTVHLSLNKERGHRSSRVEVHSLLHWNQLFKFQYITSKANVDICVYQLDA